MTAATEDFSSDLARLAQEWASITSDPGPVPHWQAEIARMSAEHSRLRATGQWRAGGRTLLRALGLHHNEVIMCRGLAWLLTPDGWHGLGSAVLDGLLGRLGVATDGSEHAVVITEEVKDIARADIVVRFEGVTVLIEAKVWAFEMGKQADRLAEGWADEPVHLVFLTRDGKDPATAVASRGDWHSLAWSDVAQIVAAAISANPDCEPGVWEYLRTIEIYGGTRP